MKSINKILFAFLFLGSLLACEKEDDLRYDVSDNLTGHWINPQIKDTIWMFDKAKKLKENDYGFVIQLGQNFLERKNSGWCGTPPISYADFEGTWHQIDSTLDITVGYWGGTVDYEWKILSVTSNKLLIYKVKEEYTYFPGR